MAAPDHPFLIDLQNVEKSNGRSRLLIWFADPAELLLYDMSAANMVVVGERTYKKDGTLALEPAQGLNILVDYAGNRWRFVRGEEYLLAFSATLGFGASELILVHPIVTPVTFPEDFVGSYGMALGTATAERRFSVHKNSDVTPFGEVIFAIATPAPAFSADETILLPGDYVTIKAPAGIDTTLANVGVTLLGTR